MKVREASLLLSCAPGNPLLSPALCIIAALVGLWLSREVVKN